MLISLKKLQLRSEKEIRMLPDTLSQRIAANYEWMLMRISPEELVHLVMEMSEQEEQPAGIVNIQYNIQNNWSSLTTIINQLINRLSVCGTSSFTYSDTVYVENILRRIGIRNPVMFIRQIRQMQQTDGQRRKLQILLQEKRESRRDWIKWLENNVRKQEVRMYLEQRKDEQKIYFLQESIYRRLQTASMTEILNRIYQSNGDSRLDRQVFYLAEQGQFGELILLEAEKNKAWIPEGKISSEKRNPYEYMEGRQQEGEPSGQVIRQSLYSQMTAAILFDLSNKFYYGKLEKENGDNREKVSINRQKWTEITQGACSSACTSLERFFIFHGEDGCQQSLEEKWQKEAYSRYEKEILCMELLEQRDLEGITEILQKEISWMHRGGREEKDSREYKEKRAAVEKVREIKAEGYDWKPDKKKGKALSQELEVRKKGLRQNIKRMEQKKLKQKRQEDSDRKQRKGAENWRKAVCSLKNLEEFRRKSNGFNIWTQESYDGRADNLKMEHLINKAEMKEMEVERGERDRKDNQIKEHTAELNKADKTIWEKEEKRVRETEEKRVRETEGKRARV